MLQCAKATFQNNMLAVHTVREILKGELYTSVFVEGTVSSLATSSYKRDLGLQNATGPYASCYICPRVDTMRVEKYSTLNKTERAHIRLDDYFCEKIQCRTKWDRNSDEVTYFKTHLATPPTAAFYVKTWHINIKRCVTRPTWHFRNELTAIKFMMGMDFLPYGIFFVREKNNEKFM